MRRYRLSWLLGLVGFVAGSFSTAMPVSSHTVYHHGVLVSTTQSSPTWSDYLGAGLHAVWIGVIFALVGMVITVILRVRRRTTS